MLRLLSKAKELVKKYNMQGIRISTRPDCVNLEVLNILKKYLVNSIELGAQSMDDVVLYKNQRGHTKDDIIFASKLIKENAFELGLQMMTGLYASSYEKDVKTAQELIDLKPKTLRVYPTVVFKDTVLFDFYKTGKYIPQSLEKAVDLCSEIIEMCERNGVDLIRLGLHSSDELKNAVAGINHPAFTELCRSNLFLRKIKQVLIKKGEYTILVNPKEISQAIGQKRDNIQKLKQLGFDVKIKADSQIEFRKFLIRGEKLCD